MPTIGFSNLSFQHPFAQIVQAGLEKAVAEHTDWELVVRDNALNDSRALANAEEFVRLPVDVAIIYHLGEKIGPQIYGTLFRNKILCIAVDIPLSPMATYFGVNNKQSGQLVGQAMTEWIHAHWGGQVDKVLVMTESRVMDFVKQRVGAAVATLSSAFGIGRDDIFYLEGKNQRHTAQALAQDVLSRWHNYERIAIIGFNDETALGALDAARTLGREPHVVVTGQGANLAPDEFANPETRMIASTAYFPERYGMYLVGLVERLLRGERIPRENYMEHICLTPATHEITG
jgi:ribose transport system substrate-binding protein